MQPVVSSGPELKSEAAAVNQRDLALRKFYVPYTYAGGGG